MSILRNKLDELLTTTFVGSWSALAVCETCAAKPSLNCVNCGGTRQQQVDIPAHLILRNLVDELDRKDKELQELKHVMEGLDK